MTTFSRLLFLSVGTLLLNTGMAQSFKPNSSGYVADPKFHQLISSEGYDLVGFFDTLQKKPLLIGAKVLKAGTWSYIDLNGKIIQDVQVTSVRRKEMEEPVIRERFDMDHDVVVPVPDFKNEMYGEEDPMAGFTQVKADGKVGFMNREKIQILETKYEQIMPLARNGNYIKAKLDGLWGVYDLAGTLILPHQFSEIRMTRMASEYPEIAFQVRKNEKVGFYALNGKQTIAPQFDNARDSWENEGLIEIGMGNKKGIMDRTGKILVPAKYLQIQPFNQYGFAIVQADDEKKLYTVIDKKGKEYLKPVYTKIEYITSSLCKVTKEGSTEMSFFNIRTGQLMPDMYSSIDDFWEGYLRVGQKNKEKILYGYADSTGKLILPAKYSYCDPIIRAGLAVAKVDSLAGVIDLKGNWIVKPKYEELSLVFETRYSKSKEKPTRIIYKEKGLMGVIDFNGNVIIPATYKRIEPNPNFYLVRNEASLCGALDLTGKIVIPVEYKSLGKMREGFFSAKKDGEKYKIDFYGGSVPE